MFYLYQDSRTLPLSFCFTFYSLFQLESPFCPFPQGKLVYTTWLVLSGNARKSERLFIIYGSRGKLSFSCSPHSLPTPESGR